MIEITSENYSAEIEQASGPVVVDVWAPWCPSCLRFMPLVEEVGQYFVGRARFAKLDKDEHEELLESFEIKLLPTVLVFKNGQKVDEHNGSMSREALTEMVEKYI